MKFLFLLNLLKFCFAELELPFIINDNGIEMERLLFGDLTNMDHLFLPPENETDRVFEDKVNETRSTKSKFYSDVWDNLKPIEGKGHDLKEFNELTNITKNIRRYYDDYDDRPFFTHETKTFELEKKERLMDINLQILIHARYFIKKVILAKTPIRSDKRYKMGYLFNRLRRLRYEQLKIVSAAKEHEKTKYRDLKTMIRMYEKIVRYDVDMTDTIMLIKTVDREPFVPYYIPEMLNKDN